MSDDLITPENVSNDLLMSVFEAAFMDASYDSDGDIMVKDKCRCWVFPDKQMRRVRLMVLFGFKSTAREMDKLTCVNKINSDYILVRATVQDTKLKFTYDVSLEGGVNKRAFVMLVKRFCSIPHEAVNDYGKELVD